MNRRTGVTLTEVLVSIFIMAIGLLALLTLFPLGALRMAQAIQDTNCAQVAVNAQAASVIKNLRNNTTWAWPSHVIIDRRNDGYRLDLKLLQETVEVNAELPATTFELENTERLEELNLDEPHKMANEPRANHIVTASARVQQHTGEVVSVDRSRNEMTIRDDAGTEAHLLITSSTKLTRSGRPIPLAEVKAGDKVTGECEASADGCKAKSIVVISPAP